MLQSIHDKLKGWVAGVVLGAIALVFVFWGINWTLSAPAYLRGQGQRHRKSPPTRCAKPISSSSRKSSARATLHSTTPCATKSNSGVLEQYVASEALVTRADELGYRVSDSELLAEMAKVPALQVDGKFDYAHALAVLVRKAVRRPKSKNSSGAMRSCVSSTRRSVPRVLRRRRA